MEPFDSHDHMVNTLTAHLNRGDSGRLLFYGRKDSGKAKAALALAFSLGPPPHQYEINAIKSRRIGETEKNLQRVLDEAETTSTLLFFDEADALFGKRTAVKDSHDKYDDLDSNGLLEFFEKHKGLIVVIAGGREKSADHYLGHYDHVVRFPVS